MSLPIKLSARATREFWEIPVLFEDDDLLAIDKPAGISLSPDPDQPNRPCLNELLHSGIRDGKPWATTRSLSFLSNVHELDRESSGVLLFAKNESALEKLSNQFGSGQLSPEYVTLVRDTPSDDQFEVSAKIAPDPGRPGYMKVDAEDGKKATTQFEILEKFRGWSLLRCVPLTSQLHQIRVHLGEIRHPVAADFKYGGKPLWLSSLKPNYRLKPGKKERPLINSPVIHSEKLTFPHPVSGGPVLIESGWPKDFKVAMKFLRLHAAD